MTPNKNNNKKEKGNIKVIRINGMWIWGAVIAIIIGYSFFSNGPSQPVAGDWNTVEKMIRDGEVERIEVLNKNTAKVYLTEEAITKYRADENSRFKGIPEHGEQLYFTIGSVDILARDVKQAIEDSELGENNPISIKYENESSSWSDIAINLLPWLFLVGVWFFFIRSMTRGGAGGAGNIMNVGKARAQVFDKDDQTKKRVTFKDVAGLEEAKVEIMEIVDF